MIDVRSALSISLTQSGGKLTVVSLVDKNSIHVEQVGSFLLHTATAQDGIFFDVLHSFSGLKNVLDQFYKDARQNDDPLPGSIGLTGFHGSFALLDQRGALLGLPVDLYSECMLEPLHLQHSPPKKMVDKLAGLPSTAPSVFEQLAELAEREDPRLHIATAVLGIPDLFVFWLTGNAATEITSAATMNMVDMSRKWWALDMLERCGIPPHIFPSIIHTGTLLGRFEGGKFISAATNRVASAVAAATAEHDDYAYLLVEDRSYAGTELESPILKRAVRRTGLTNHTGAFGTSLLTAETAGLKVLQRYAEAVSQEEGTEYTLDGLVELAEQSEPFKILIDPNTPILHYAGHMAGLVASAAQDAGQPTPESPGEGARAILEGLALSYAAALESVAEVSGKQLSEVHLLGDGAALPALCQMVANATGRRVVAGPVDAAELGSAAVQFATIGVEDASIFRKRIANSAIIGTYDPRDQESWEDAYNRFTRLITY